MFKYDRIEFSKKKPDWCEIERYIPGHIKIYGANKDDVMAHYFNPKIRYPLIYCVLQIPNECNMGYLVVFSSESSFHYFIKNQIAPNMSNFPTEYYAKR